MYRPPRQVAERLLAANGTYVTVREFELVEGPAGQPVGITTEIRKAVLNASAQGLGWSDAELEDPTNTD